MSVYEIDPPPMPAKPAKLPHHFGDYVIYLGSPLIPEEDYCIPKVFNGRVGKVMSIRQPDGAAYAGDVGIRFHNNDVVWRSHPVRAVLIPKNVGAVLFGEPDAPTEAPEAPTPAEPVEPTEVTLGDILKELRAMHETIHGLDSR